MSDPVQEWCDEVNEKESAGVLTFKDAPIMEYLELQDGQHAGRIVIKPHKFAEIDSEPITWFARGLTWIRVKEIESCVVMRKRIRFD